MEDDDFEKTLDWADKEEQIRLTRGNSISSFKLIAGCLIIFFIVFLILYYTKHEKKAVYNALNMMNDPNNFYDDEFKENENNENENEDVNENNEDAIDENGDLNDVKGNSAPKADIEVI